jgi:hypothetical protein
VVHRL